VAIPVFVAAYSLGFIARFRNVTAFKESTVYTIPVRESYATRPLAILHRLT